MTDDEWQLIETEAKGLWGTSNRELVDQRMAAWRKRWRHEHQSTMLAALKILEHTAEHWPSVARVHAAVDEVKARHQPAPTRQREPDHPMTAREWTETAMALVAAARDRVRSGRGSEGDGWHRYLLALAEHYERNARLVRDGDLPDWPPPWSSAMPSSLRGMLAPEAA